MYNICIDAGNTAIKIALTENSVIQSVAAFSLWETDTVVQYLKSLPQADVCIISNVSSVGQAIVDIVMQKSEHFMELTADTPVPIRNLYKTPDTLGKDRLAAIVGALSLFPGKYILVFDVGTALTIDFIDSGGNYHGGNISPGLNMRFRALHEFTQKLPLQSQTDNYQSLGNDTASAIVSGVQFGMVFEMKYYIDQFVKKKPALVKILTGGDINFFENKFETYIFAEPNLVFIGLEKIIEFNYKLNS